MTMIGAGQRAQIGKQAHRVLQRKPDRERLMDQAERLEQIDIDVSREIGWDRKRQRQQPQQHLPAAKFMQRHCPRRAGADRKRQGAYADQQQRGVEKAARQHVLNEGLPDVRRRLHRQHDDGDDRRCDEDRGRNRDHCGDPARARGAGHAGSHRQEAGPCSIMPSPGEGEGMLAEVLSRRGAINYRTRPCPPASRPPCGWRRSWRSASDRRRACRSPQWSG